jgi:serine/threonine protein phosphatase PrpC
MGTVEVSHGPITTKNTLDNVTSMLRYGICEMQGWRRTMEDATMAIADFDKKNSYLFGVMDGHGGKNLIF